MKYKNKRVKEKRPARRAGRFSFTDINLVISVFEIFSLTYFVTSIAKIDYAKTN
ncbi:hypothetical protein KC845_02485 [Candidatus Kaiserbacteria bacterium]|nr:hypothetical protein [Candidatus Kaiserbacteria bacterium]